jgi:hypothetical protein
METIEDTEFDDVVTAIRPHSAAQSTHTHTRAESSRAYSHTDCFLEHRHVQTAC